MNKMDKKKAIYDIYTVNVKCYFEELKIIRLGQLPGSTLLYTTYL